MFANRFTAFVDACSLAGVLRRNLLLSLAEAEFFRLRWSRPVLDETERAIIKMMVGRQIIGAEQKARRAITLMEDAFEEATVADFEAFLYLCEGLPDQGDAHVAATALKVQAAVIVTENLKHFPTAILGPLNIEVRSTDAFIADTIALDMGKAVAAVRRMRERMKRPERSADRLLMDMEANELTETVDVLRPTRSRYKSRPNPTRFIPVVRRFRRRQSAQRDSSARMNDVAVLPARFRRASISASRAMSRGASCG